MERETKTIVTPSGAKVVVNTYITGRESEQIQDILYKSVNFSAMASNANKEANLNLNSGSFITEQTHKIIEIMVVSIDGSNENVLNAVLDMKEIDYSFVVDEINRITKGEIDQKLKKK